MWVPPMGPGGSSPLATRIVAETDHGLSHKMVEELAADPIQACDVFTH